MAMILPALSIVKIFGDRNFIQKKAIGSGFNFLRIFYRSFMVLRTRLIPVLLLQDGGLVKGQQYTKHKYVGDPINTVKIFNEKEVDELIFLDISATAAAREPCFDLIADIAGEAFMPLGYGGGISSVNQVEKLFSLGVEKVIINSRAFFEPKIISEAASVSGNQSIVVSMDVKKSFFGNYEVFVNNGQLRTRVEPAEYAKKVQDLGAGELIVGSIDREGTGKGYDLELLNSVANAVDIPVVGLGGAGSLKDMAEAKNKTSLSALAAGDLFIFHGKYKAVLITYPKYTEFDRLLD